MALNLGKLGGPKAWPHSMLELRLVDKASGRRVTLQSLAKPTVTSRARSGGEAQGAPRDLRPMR